MIPRVGDVSTSPIIAVLDAHGDDSGFAEVAGLLAAAGIAVRRGAVVGCTTCGFLKPEDESCWACQIRAVHREDCRFRRAATCAVPIECEHGRDACPVCDACTCPSVAL